MTAKSTATGIEDGIPSCTERSASTAYVSGSMYVIVLNHAGSESRGKRAPDRNKSGNTMKLMITWKPSRLSKKEPIVSPTETMPIARMSASRAKANNKLVKATKLPIGSTEPRD